MNYQSKLLLAISLCAVPFVVRPATNDVPASPQPKAADKLQTNSPSVPYKVFFSTGAKFLSPFTINVDTSVSPPTGTLEKSGNSTVPFLEFAYLNRFVLRTDGQRDPGRRATKQWDGKDCIVWPPPFLSFPDIEAHLGFTFPSGTSSTNFSASTIAGGGDFYDEGSIGFPIARYVGPAQAHQLTLEGAGGFVTDKSFEAVHPEAFAGVGYQVSFVVASNTTGFFFARAGYGWLDSPKVLGTTDTGTTVEVEGGLPKFEFTGSPSVGASLVFPLNETIFLIAGGNVYFRDNPAPWNITIGASIPFEKLTGIFKPLIGN